MRTVGGPFEVIWLMLDEMDEADRTRWLRSIEGRTHFPRRELRDRLIDYRLGVEFGRYADLREAVRVNAAKRRQEHAEKVANSHQEWQRLQAKKARKRWYALRELILATGDPCSYCGGPADTVDHVLPRAQGGQDDLRNLAPACKSCNAEKNWRTVEQWKAKRLASGESWPPAPRVILAKGA